MHSDLQVYTENIANLEVQEWQELSLVDVNQIVEGPTNHQQQRVTTETGELQSA